ncbi:MAG: alpha-glucosidase [Spirochaetaceae bacterium]|nr:alpha-glucosidase [Spirochaetaceae bacterium]
MNLLPWWKTRIAYQIYPRSFCDSNNDGIGDIPGIISKLDYLVELGVGILWLSPVYRSPNDDNGYDISGYREINPEFGTMDDMKNLIAEAKKRGLKLVMDLVVNHTSDEHPWFQESRKSKDNPYRSYYIWQPGRTAKTGKKIPPNNWSSFFTGSAWEYDKTTDEYYLHLFSKKQPDLNYNNPDVISAVKDIMTFWLDLGIDGFRCDVINVIFKTSLANGKKRLALTGREWYHCQEGCHKILAELRRDVLSKYDCVAIGETVLVNTKQANELCASERKELDMVFSFEHVECDQINNKWFKLPFKPQKFMETIEKWQNELDWNALYFENHDQPRSVSRFGNKKYLIQSAKMLSMLLLTLRGTPFIYEGQELAMENGEFQDINEFQDIESHKVWQIATNLHFPYWLKMKMLHRTSRDNARTPMQWNNSKNAGFSPDETVKPWLKINSNKDYINVEAEKADSNSVFNWYKKLILLRRNTPELVGGKFKMIYKNRNIFAYQRTLSEVAGVPEKKSIVVINFSGKKHSLPTELKAALDSLGSSVVLCSVYEETKNLPPYAAFIVRSATNKTDFNSSGEQ